MGFFKKVVKAVTNVVKSPSRLALAGFTGGVSELTGWGKKIANSGVGKTLDMAGYVAAAVAGGAAALGAMGGGAAAAGVGGTSAAVGGGAAAATGGGSLLTAGNIMGAASAAQGVVSYISSQDQAKEQARAQQRAQDQAAQAQRESEIMRKQALLTAQMSVGQRINHAAAVANRLKNTNTSSMGGDEEKLGG